jgi:hypothetical protein
MKRIVIFVFLSWLNRDSFAQSQLDVFRISNDQYLPSARAQGMGGAFGAIGADASSVFTNPAGIGIYKTGVMDFGCTLLTKTQHSTFDGREGMTQNTDVNLSLPIDHFTWVKSYPVQNSDWKMVNVAISHGKLNHYSRSFEISAPTNNTSLLDAFALEAENTTFSNLNSNFPFSSGLAWATYGVDTVAGTTDSYFANFNGGNVNQLQKVQQDGKKTDFAGVLAANFRDQLFLGASLSLLNYTFSEKITHQETYPDAGEVMQSMTYSSDLSVQGTSAQIRLGAIWIPERYPWWRIGMAYHSGANYYCTDEYSAEMSTQLINANYQMSSPINQLNYYMRAPKSVQLNTAFNVADHVLIGCDVVQQNFSKGDLSTANDIPIDYSEVNSLIRQQGMNSTKIRLGAEWRVAGPLRLRVGWDFQTKPYVQAGNIQNFHSGIGWRGENIFCDASLSMGNQSQNWYLYNSNLISAAEVRSFQTFIRMSIGWRLSDFHQQEDPAEMQRKGSGTGDF